MTEPGWLKRQGATEKDLRTLIGDLRRLRGWTTEEVAAVIGAKDANRVSNIVNRGTRMLDFEIAHLEDALLAEADPANRAWLRTRHPGLLTDAYPTDGPVRRLMDRMFTDEELTYGRVRRDCVGANGQFFVIRRDTDGRLLISHLWIAAAPGEGLPSPFLMIRPMDTGVGLRSTRGIMFELGNEVYMLGKPRNASNARLSRLAYHPQSTRTDMHGLRISKSEGRLRAYRLYFYHTRTRYPSSVLRSVIGVRTPDEFDHLRSVIRNLDDIVSELGDVEFVGNSLLGARLE